MSFEIEIEIELITYVSNLEGKWAWCDDQCYELHTKI